MRSRRWSAQRIAEQTEEQQHLLLKYDKHMTFTELKMLHCIMLSLSLTCAGRRSLNGFYSIYLYFLCKNGLQDL